MDEKKVREAIEALKYINLKRVHPFLSWEEMMDVRNIAIEALEKQLAKKPKDKSSVRGDIFAGYVGTCPSCNGVVDDSMIVCDCTQVLDWSE